jgi:uncharacterized membrane protein
VAAIGKSEAPVHIGKFTLRMPTMEDPWRWLAKGWADLKAAPALSLGYGAAFVTIGLAGTAGLWFAGFQAMIPIAAAGFALVGPVLAVGLYELSRRLEQGQRARLGDLIFVRTAAPAQIGFMAFLLIFIYLVWLRLATLLVALFVYDNFMPLDRFLAFVLTTPEGLTLLVVGSVVGGLLALVTFAISALSIPLLMHKDVDAFTAISASMQVMMDSPGPMLLWAWLIGVLIAFGIATMFVGLIVVFPLIGHATWHAYRSVVSDT